MLEDREAEKQKLQSLMTYGTEVPPDAVHVRPAYHMNAVRDFDEDDKEALFDHCKLYNVYCLGKTPIIITLNK